jgi:hypothetical protein
MDIRRAHQARVNVSGVFWHDVEGVLRSGLSAGLTANRDAVRRIGQAEAYLIMSAEDEPELARMIGGGCWPHRSVRRSGSGMVP